MEVIALFDQRDHGKGGLVTEWHPSGEVLAYMSSSRVVWIVSRTGKVVEQIQVGYASYEIELVVGMELNWLIN